MQVNQFSGASVPDSKNRFRRNRFSCAVCRKHYVARPTHCYICGGSDHFKIDCKDKSEN